jgi:hypothetical protein
MVAQTITLNLKFLKAQNKDKFALPVLIAKDFNLISDLKDESSLFIIMNE